MAHPNLPPGHPPLGAGSGAGEPPMGNSGDMPTTTPGATGPVDPTKVLSGVIEVSSKLKDQVKPSDVVFLSVRQEQNGMPGQVLAVDRFESKQFPIPFAIDATKAMVPGTKFTGSVLITVRVDKDGDAMTKNPGDLVGTKRSAIPAKHLSLLIDQVLK